MPNNKSLINAINRIVQALKSVFINRDSAHDEIHVGWSFRTCFLDESLADNETIAIAFKTANTDKLVNLVASVETAFGVHVDLIEGTTWDNGSGAVLPVYNRHRLKNNVTNILEDSGQAAFVAGNAISNPTTIAGGTAIPIIHKFSAAQKSSIVGRGSSEWILNKDTQYVVLLTSDNNNNGGMLCVDFYEHTD